MGDWISPNGALPGALGSVGGINPITGETVYRSPADAPVGSTLTVGSNNNNSTPEEIPVSPPPPAAVVTEQPPKSPADAPVGGTVQAPAVNPPTATETPVAPPASLDASNANSILDSPEVPTNGVISSGVAGDTGYTGPTDTVTVKSGTEYMTPETNIGTQLDKLIDPESTYIKRASALGREEANRMGLASTSMASGAAVGQAIDKAGALASKQVEINSQFMGNQQKAEANIGQVAYEGLVSGELNKQEAAINEKAADIQMKFKEIEAIKDRKFTAKIKQSEQEFQAELQTFITQANDDLSKWTTGEANVQQTRNSVNTIVTNYQIALEKMLSNPDILSLEDPNALPNAMNALKVNTIAGLKFTVDSAGLQTEFKPYLDKLFDSWGFK